MKVVDDLARMFLMIPWLQNHQGVSVTEAAEHFGLDPRRLLDELRRLTCIGASTEAIAYGGWDYLISFDMDEADDTGRLFVSSEYVDRPLTLSPSEAVTLIVALRGMQDLVGAELRPHVASTLAKLEAIAGEAAGRIDVDVQAGAADVRDVLSEAISAGQRLQLTYDGANRGVTTYPVVDPVAVIVRRGAAYLQAWSLDRDAWRTYRVTRIAAAVPLEAAAQDHGPPPPLGQDWFEGQPIGSVVLDLAPAGQYLAEYDPVQDVVETGDADWPLRVRFAVADDSFLTQRLLRLADAARVVEPAGAGSEAARIAQAALAAYDALDENAVDTEAR